MKFIQNDLIAPLINITFFNSLLALFIVQA